MSDEGEVLVGLPQQLGVPLVRVLRDRMRNAGDDAVEENLELAEGELYTVISRGGDDGVAEGAVLAHHRVEAEAKPKPLFTVPGRGRTLLRRRADR